MSSFYVAGILDLHFIERLAESEVESDKATPKPCVFRSNRITPSAMATSCVFLTSIIALVDICVTECVGNYGFDKPATKMQPCHNS